MTANKKLYKSNIFFLNFSQKETLFSNLKFARIIVLLYWQYTFHIVDHIIFIVIHTLAVP